MPVMKPSLSRGSACIDLECDCGHASHHPARGAGSVLDEAIAVEGMERTTLEAMLSAVESRRPTAWKYHELEHKHSSMSGFGSVIWVRRSVSVSRPLSLGTRPDLVLSAFDAYHPALMRFAEEMFHYQRTRQSLDLGSAPVRIARAARKTGRLASSDLSRCSRRCGTLARELGHAYRNAVMADMRFWACGYPASLAETASILAETLVGDYLLEDPKTSHGLRLQVLDKRLHSAAVYMLNIPMRYEFERRS